MKIQNAYQSNYKVQEKMKKYLLIPILCLTALSSFAQNPQWFELGATWTYNWNGVADPDQVDYTYDYSVTEITEHLGETCSKIEADQGEFSCLVYQAPYYMYKSNDTIYFATDEMDSFAIGYVLSDGAEWQYEAEVNGNSVIFNVSVTDVYTTNVDGMDLPTYTIEYNPESGEFVEISPAERTVISFLGDLNMFIIPFGKNGVCDFEINEELRCFSSSTLSYQNPDFSSCTLGIDEAEVHEDIKIYPNPAGDFVNIEFENQLHSKVQIIDATGRLVQSVQLNASPQRINLEDLNPGIYFLAINSGFRSSVIEKFVLY